MTSQAARKKAQAALQQTQRSKWRTADSDADAGGGPIKSVSIRKPRDV